MTHQPLNRGCSCWVNINSARAGAVQLTDLGAVRLVGQDRFPDKHCIATSNALAQVNIAHNSTQNQ